MSSRRSQKILAGIALAAATALSGFIGAAVLPAAALAQAPRDQGAEAFVQTQGQRVISILANKSQGAGDKMRAFRAVVDEVADVPRITSFVLGKYARTITPAQMQRFAPVFRDYAQEVYQRRLSDFHGDTLKVTGSLVRKPGDVVVNTTISSGEANEPAQVGWRVLKEGSDWKVVDVEVSGVWLAITQQQDFVSTIDNHNGDIDALTSILQKLTERGAATAKQR
jgi:phospholipid transport system substrate-binding protein